MGKLTATHLMAYAIATGNNELTALLIVAAALEVLAPKPNEQPATTTDLIHRIEQLVHQPVTGAV